MTERKAGKSGANDALNVAIKKFGDNIIAERGAGSELADYDIILTVAGTVKWEVVEEIQRDLSKQGFETYSTEIKKTKSSTSQSVYSLISFSKSPKVLGQLDPKYDAFPRIAGPFSIVSSLISPCPILSDE